MPAYFVPPVAPLVPAAVDPSHPSYDLFKHYRPWDAGINVWLMPNGVVTTVEPAAESDAVRVFHGGHIHTVDDVEAAALAAAGFVLTEITLPSPTAPLPGFDDSNVTPAVGTYGFGFYGDDVYGGTPNVGLA